MSELAGGRAYDCALAREEGKKEGRKEGSKEVKREGRNKGSTLSQLLRAREPLECYNNECFKIFRIQN